MILLLLRPTLGQLMSSYTVTPNTPLAPSASYFMAFNLGSLTLSSTSSIYIVMDPNFVTINPTSCRIRTGTTGPTTSISCQQTTYSGSTAILFDSLGISGVVTYYELTFLLTNPATSGTFLLKLYTIDSSGSPNLISFSLAFAAAQMTCTLSSTATTTGQQSTSGEAYHNFRITPAVNIQSGSFIQFQYPNWLNPTTYASNTVGTLVCSSASIPGVTCTSGSNAAGQVFTSSVTASTISSVFTLTLSPMKNPPNGNQFGPITVGVYNNSNNNIVQSCSVTLQATQPNSFSIFSVAGSNSVIGSTSSTVSINLRPNSPIPASGAGQIRVSFDSTLSLTLNNAVNSILSISSTSTGLISLSTVSSSMLASLFQIRNLVVVNPPSSKAATITVTSYYNDGSVAWVIDSSTFTINCAVSAITASSVTQSNSNPSTSTTVTLIFTTVNPLVATSSIVVGIPAEMGSGSGSCSGSGLSAGTCSITAGVLTLLPSQAIPAGSQLTLSLNSLLNPNAAQTTSSFTITTYYSSTDSATVVDRVTSGLTLAIQVKPLLPSAFLFTPNSLVVGQLTSYSFEITVGLLVPGYFVLTFPPQFSLTSPGFTVVGASLPAGCSATFAGNVVTSTGCSNIAAGTTIKFSISGVNNPISLKPTAPFVFETFNGAGAGVESLRVSASNLIATMVTVQTSTVTLTPAVHSLGQVSALTVSLTFALVRASNDYLLINFPAAAVTPSAASCSVVSGISGVTCTLTGSVLKAVLQFTTFPVNKAISFTIGNYPNSQTALISVDTYSSNNFQSQASSYTITPCPLNCDLCSSASVCTTCYTPYLLNGAVCVSTCPTGKYNAGVSCQPCPLACSGCTSPTVCTGCNNPLLLSAGSCVASCLTGFYNNLGVCTACSTNCLVCTATACSSCSGSLLTSGSSCVVACPANSVRLGSACVQCPTGCSSCTSSTSCSACTLPYLLSGTTCSTGCPASSYSSAGICLNCVPPCNSCSSSTLCLTCQSGYSFSAGTCTSGCGVGSFQGASSCQPCSSGCASCTSASSCSKCSPDLFLSANSCSGSCSAGLVAVQGVCYSCSQQCKSCSGSASNCTQCSSGVLTSSGCAASCPPGLVNNSGVCGIFTGTLVYFPFSITSLFWTLAVVGLKYFHPSMTAIPNIIPLVALSEFASWLYYASSALADIEFFALKTTSAAVVLAAFILQIITGIVFLVVMSKRLQDQPRFQQWDRAAPCHRARIAISAFSLLNLKFFRLLYGRLLSKAMFSAYTTRKQQFFTTVNVAAVANLLLSGLPTMVGAGLALSQKLVRSQAFFCGLDLIIVTFYVSLLVIYDIPKQEGYFADSVQIDHGVTDKPWQSNGQCQFTMTPQVTEDTVWGNCSTGVHRARLKVLEKMKGGKKGLPCLDQEDEDEEQDLEADHKRRLYSEPDETRKIELVRRVLGDEAVDQMFANDQQRRQFRSAVIQNRLLWQKREKSLPDEDTLKDIYESIREKAKVARAKENTDRVPMTEEKSRGQEELLLEQLGLAGLKEVGVSFKDKMLIQKGKIERGEEPKPSLPQKGKGRYNSSLRLSSVQPANHDTSSYNLLQPELQFKAKQSLVQVPSSPERQQKNKSPGKQEKRGQQQRMKDSIKYDSPSNKREQRLRMSNTAGKLQSTPRYDAQVISKELDSAGSKVLFSPEMALESVPSRNSDLAGKGKARSGSGDIQDQVIKKRHIGQPSHIKVVPAMDVVQEQMDLAYMGARRPRDRISQRSSGVQFHPRRRRRAFDLDETDEKEAYPEPEIIRTKEEPKGQRVEREEEREEERVQQMRRKKGGRGRGKDNKLGEIYLQRIQIPDSRPQFRIKGKKRREAMDQLNDVFDLDF